MKSQWGDEDGKLSRFVGVEMEMSSMLVVMQVNGGWEVGARLGDWREEEGQTKKGLRACRARPPRCPMIR